MSEYQIKEKCVNSNHQTQSHRIRRSSSKPFHGKMSNRQESLNEKQGGCCLSQRQTNIWVLILGIHDGAWRKECGKTGLIMFQN